MDQLNNPIKLHLGCGGQYLKGYVNIDYPQSSHTTHTIKADRYMDLKELSYPNESASEIRLHHVFEHFSRQWALKLLTRWRDWLMPNGTLIIETPDYDECLRLRHDASLEYKFKLDRHIFGSHEAHWAFHYDGWSEEKFRFVLEKLGFKDFEFKKTLAYHSNITIPKVGGAINRTPFEGLKNATGVRLPNITVTAHKASGTVDYEGAIREILELSMVGDEQAMLAAWLTDIGLA